MAQWQTNGADPRLTGFAGQRGGVVPPPASSGWGGWQPIPTLTVRNSTCQLEGVDPQVQWWLRDQLVVLTESAQMQAEGWSPPETGELDQAWDGKIRLYEVQPGGESGKFSCGLLEHVKELLATLGIRQTGQPGALEIHDQRTRPESGVPETDRSGVPLRQYQIEAVDAAERVGRGVWKMPPRAGKTRCGVEFVRRVALPTVWLAPTKGIVAQTVRVFDAHLGKNYAVAHVGSNWTDVADKHVVVVTYDTARSLPAAFWKTRQVLMVDEVHHAAAAGFKVINRLIDHIFYRVGMSGTFFRSNGDDLAMHSFLSGVLYEVTPRFLVENGYLVPASVAMVPVPATTKIRTANHHDTIAKGIVGHEFRQAASAWAAQVFASRGKKVVVLVAQKPQGDDLVKRIRELLPNKVKGTEFNRVEFVSTNRTTAVCERILKAFTTSDEVQVLIGTSMVGEGTDLPPADCLVYAYGGKAEVGHRQAAYRVCTAAHGKRRAFIVDFADRHHRTLIEHSVDRLDHYLDEETFSTTVLDRLDYLPGWLDHAAAL